MATKCCLLCKEEKTPAHFIAIKSALLGGSMPICRTCIAKEIEIEDKEQRWNKVDKICQLADIPFIPTEFEKLYTANGKDTFGVYCHIFKDKRYESLDWGVYNKAYLQLQEEERVEDSMPALNEAKLNQLRRKWGPDYEIQDLEYLENLHKGISATAGIVGALNEDQVLKICKISLIIEEKIRAGVDFTKDLKAYDDLCKLAGITTEAVKDGAEFGSTGELYAFLEKIGFKIQYYDGAIRDEPDKTMKDIQYWCRYLYINETGIAEDIKERIENLKIADRMNNEDFDWKGYNNFAEDVSIDDNFDIDI